MVFITSFKRNGLNIRSVIKEFSDASSCRGFLSVVGLCSSVVSFLFEKEELVSL